MNKYITKYNIKWFIESIKSGANFRYETFWENCEDVKNNFFSQWFDSNFTINGRVYNTCEKYMMSEKAILFRDFDSYVKIMDEKSPEICKKYGREVKNFDAAIWDTAFREIIFTANVAKFTKNEELKNRLLSTADAVLIEASPYDDICGAGIIATDLIDENGKLKVAPQNWHKKDSSRQAENNLGFVLMGVRDYIREVYE